MSVQWQVYFAEEKFTGLIKIGCTSTTLATRMNWLRWNGDTPHSMNLWWSIPVSDKKAERWFQRHFVSYRTRTHAKRYRREWFEGITVEQVKKAIDKYFELLKGKAGNGRRSA